MGSYEAVAERFVELTGLRHRRQYHCASPRVGLANHFWDLSHFSGSTMIAVQEYLGLVILVAT